MDRSVDGRKACNSDMHSLDLNPLVKEADLLKQAAEILEGSNANTADICFKIKVQVEEMKEGLQALKILLGKEKAQLQTSKVWWNFLNFKSFIFLSNCNPIFRSHM
jgi:hypothetical protein